MRMVLYIFEGLCVCVAGSRQGEVASKTGLQVIYSNQILVSNDFLAVPSSMKQVPVKFKRGVN